MSTLTLDLELIKSFLASLKSAYDGTRGHRNLLGLRGAVPGSGTSIQTVRDEVDCYNDTLVVFGEQANGQPLVRTYRASVDPGRYHTLNPSAELPAWRRGCAHLLNGQYRYQLGTHKGYPALNQADRVAVWRDMNRDFIRNGKDFVERGFFGINIHAGGSTAQVGKWSAGCSVLWGGRFGQPWKSFIGLMQESSAHAYWYTLADASDLIEFHQQGAGAVDPNTLPAGKRQALQQVLAGMVLLYGYQEAAELGPDGELTFLQLLNRLRSTGILANLKPEQRPPVPPVGDAAAARARLIEGFRMIYGNLLASGLDQAFHAQLNQLRRFGALAEL